MFTGHQHKIFFFFSSSRRHLILLLKEKICFFFKCQHVSSCRLEKWSCCMSQTPGAHLCGAEIITRHCRVPLVGCKTSGTSEKKTVQSFISSFTSSTSWLCTKIDRHGCIRWGWFRWTCRQTWCSGLEGSVWQRERADRQRFHLGAEIVWRDYKALTWPSPESALWLSRL